jgi:SAM-dependent methyltransferase
MESTDNSQEDYLKQLADNVGKDWITSPYYEEAEQKWLHVFWGPNSLFHKMFNQLDHSLILELACGHGRHSAQMQDWDNQKILMDINQSNIDYCVERFSGDPRYAVMINNGYDCKPLGNESCTAVFCYDAMVHFDSEIVLSYLKDISRILKSGGRALLHHSNYTGNPGGHYAENPHCRNFMSQSLFAHYSKKSGLNIVESVTIKWGHDPDLDCLTLVSKPK